MELNHDLHGIQCKKPLKVTVTFGLIDVRIEVKDDQERLLAEVGIEYYKNRLGYFIDDPHVETLISDVSTYTPPE